MSAYQRVYGSFEQGFIGSCTICILVQSCIGSVAAMTILMGGTGLMQMVQLFFVVSACMLFNGAVLSQQKPRVVFNLLLWSVGICSLLATYNIFI